MSDSIPITTVVRDAFRVWDASLAAFLRRNGRTPPCKPGCAACCELLALITWPEAIVLAERLGRRRLVERFLPALIDQAKACCFDTIDPGSYFMRRIRCAFLTDDQLCAVYSDRPFPCRFHVVFGPAETCGIRDLAQGVETLDTAPILAAATKPILEALAEQVANAYEAAPLPIMVLAALVETELVQPDELAGVLPPRDWLERYGAHCWGTTRLGLAEARAKREAGGIS